MQQTLSHEVLADIHRLHGPYLLRALLRVTNGDRGRAEDILQETLMRAWRNPQAFEGAESARPWLFTVARRIAIDHYRMRAARVQEVAESAVAEQPERTDPYDQVLDAAEIAEALRQITPQHREVLVELHLKGRTVVEAAEVLGIPVGTVKSRSYYAARALRPVLAARGLATRGLAASA